MIIFGEQDWGVDLIEGAGEVIHGSGDGISNEEDYWS